MTGFQKMAKSFLKNHLNNMKHLKEIKNWKELINEVVCCDCKDGMAMIPDKAIDLVLTDPPYGINIGGTKTIGGTKLACTKVYGKHDWDKEIPKKEVFDEIFRISENQTIFGGNYFVEYLRNSSCWLVWDKNNSGGFADCELAWTSFKSAVRKFKYTWNGMLQEDMKNKEYRHHPTQKPAELMRWILENYSKEGDLICDPFMGSWTTARACKDLGRDFIGFELSPEYCRIGEERLRQEVMF
jgi:site-specific DNA-methyltransferase (adenine-specific)